MAPKLQPESHRCAAVVLLKVADADAGGRGVTVPVELVVVYERFERGGIRGGEAYTDDGGIGGVRADYGLVVDAGVGWVDGCEREGPV